MPIIDQAGRAGATTTYARPPRDLEPVVVEVWIQRYTDAIRAEGRRWRVVSDVQPHLIVHSHLDGPPRGPRVVGARSTWLDTRVVRRAWSVGVTLRPGTLPALTGLPASDFGDRSAAPEEVWGARGARLGEAVAAAGSPDEAIQVLQAFIRETVGRPGTAVDWRVRGFSASRRLGRAGGIGGVGEIAAELGVSPRTLRQVCREEVGLSPREVLSIERLHRAVRRALAYPGRTAWAGVARAVGFYDQPHLIRDFRRFLGETPERFLSRGAPGGS